MLTVGSLFSGIGGLGVSRAVEVDLSRLHQPKSDFFELVVEFFMDCSATNKEVVRIIVQLVAVNVVNYFLAFDQWATKGLLCHYGVFGCVGILPAAVRRKNHLVAKAVNVKSTPPRLVCAATGSGGTHELTAPSPPVVLEALVCDTEIGSDGPECFAVSETRFDLFFGNGHGRSLDAQLP